MGELPLQHVSEALCTDPQAGVVVVARDGTVVHCNRRAVRLFRGEDAAPEDVVGRSMHDLLPAAYVEERGRVLERIASDGRPRILRTIWRGEQIASWVHFVPPEEVYDGGGHFLAIVHRVSGPLSEAQLTDGDVETNESSVIDLGPLDVLSTRELEVLALFGQGLGTQSVAARLHRSPRTIENHRDTIARKLRTTDRATLIALAQRAGLGLEDARRERLPVAEIEAPPPRTVTPEAPPDGLWSHFAGDPLAALSIVDLDGVVLYCNEQAVRVFRGETGETPDDLIGRSFAEWAPADWTDERLRIVRAIAADRRPRTLRTIWRGWQQVSWMHGLPDGDEPDAPIDRVLVVTRRIEGPIDEGMLGDGAGVEHVTSEANDLGALASLTPREVEVLALIGQGATTAQIAQQLDRSVKTIERHRTAIGRKLDGAGRGELILLARRAGLSVRTPASTS